VFRLLVIVFVSLVIFHPYIVVAEIYTWQDEFGNTHFGDKQDKTLEQQAVNLAVTKSQWEKYNIEINDVDNVLTEDERQQIQQDVNSVYQFYDNTLYFDMYKTVPVKIRLYEKRRDYRRYLAQEYEQKNTRHSRGVYMFASNEIIIVLNEKERWRTFWTIKHETSHAILDKLVPLVPGWLNEGLAENAEALDYVNSKLVLNPHRENHTTMHHSSEKGLKVNLERFLSMSNKAFYQSLQTGGGINQAISGELVRLLLSTRTGRDFIVELIHNYERGNRQFSSIITQQQYVGGITVLQTDWDQWVTRTLSQKVSL
jgi:hypothetical protein